MQNVQVLLHPTEMATQLDTFDARSVGSWQEVVEFLFDLDLRMAFDARLVKQLRQGANVLGTEHGIRRGPFLRSSHGRAVPCIRRLRSAGSGAGASFRPTGRWYHTCAPPRFLAPRTCS